MRNLSKLTISALAIVLIAGCGTSPEEARQKLADLNIEYTKESFAEHAGRGDMQAVDLFLKTGMDPNQAMPAAVVNDRIQVIQRLQEAGAEPIIPQARPYITFLNAVKNRDVEHFKYAFSQQHKQDYNLNNTRQAEQIISKLRSEYVRYLGSEGLEVKNYSFEFNGGSKRGKLNVIYKLEPKPAAPIQGKWSEEHDVVKMNGRWRLNERP